MFEVALVAGDDERRFPSHRRSDLQGILQIPDAQGQARTRQMSIGTADFKILRDPPLHKFRKRLAVNVKSIGHRVTGRSRHERAPLRQAANLQAGGIMWLPPFIHVEDDVGIHENFHACFLRRYS